MVRFAGCAASGKKGQTLRETAIISVRALAVVLLVATFAPQAAALEIFGIRLFGEEEPKTLPPDAVSYTLRFDVTPLDSDLKDTLQEASILHTMKDEVPPDMAALVSRAMSDRARLVAALYENARYGGTVAISINGQRLQDIRAIPNGGGRKTARVAVKIDAGPVFRFGRIDIRTTRSYPEGPGNAPADYGLKRGGEARSTSVIAAGQRLVDAWRDAGHPFAKLVQEEAVADHPNKRLDVTLVVDPGPLAVFGRVDVRGTERMDPDFVRRQTGIVAGTRYSPAVLKRARERISQLDVFETIRIREGDHLDATGGLPVTVSVEEKKRRFVGASANWSSIDGGGAEVYWGHRNLFGEAEKLRLNAAVSQLGNGGMSNLEYEVGAQFTKPGIFDPDTDLTASVKAVREHPEAYKSTGIFTAVGLTHRFDKYLTASLGVEGQVSKAEDAFGTHRYNLVGVPANVAYDTRDNPLNATKGMRAVFQLVPFLDVKDIHTFVLGRADASTYVALDEKKRYILAGRVAAGFIAGTGIENVPPDRRFFAGGGGSIRGYAYRNVGPRLDGDVVGGRSLLEASAEFRARITESIGLVPFVDLGAVSESPYPGSDMVFKIGVGLGLRYYTSFGPIRLDFAVPLSPDKDDPDFALYVGLGQAF